MTSPSATIPDVPRIDLRQALPAGSCPLTLVVPVYNEEEVLPELVARLRSALEALPTGTEVIFVNDGSSDRTRELLAEACRANDGFFAVHFSRNFGHQQAISAGLSAARGDAVAVLDGDLQDPPEQIAAFCAKLQEGYDVVYAVRQNRRENLLKRLSYWLFYRLLSAVTPIDIPLDSGDFGIMSRRIVNHLKSMPERHRFVRGMRGYLGFRQTGLGYDRAARAAGKPKYSFWRLVGLAAEGVFTFSEFPLRLATFLGFVIAVLSIVYGIILFAWRILTDEPLPGFATLAIAILFLGGVQLICLGILGEYVGRIHNEVKQRPPFIVEEVDIGESGE